MIDIAVIIFGIGVYLLSLIIAYGKIKENKKKFLHQLMLIIILLVIWLILILIRYYLVKSGLSVDNLTVKKAGVIELLINAVYPFIIAPLIAMFAAVFKVVK